MSPWQGAQIKGEKVESLLLNKIYSLRPRPSIRLTITAAKTIWARKVSGKFTGPDDIAATSLPAPTLADWIHRNNVVLEAPIGTNYGARI